MTVDQPVADHVDIGSRLRSAVRGAVCTPDDASWAERSLPWSLVPQHPLAVVEVVDSDDVAAVVRCASECGVPVAAQPVGSGASLALDGTILLRTNRLDRVEIDPATRLARIGAGVGWQQVLDAASPHGLTALVGSSTHPSVAGFCLGGGLSWFGRAHGLACNTVRSFDVVTADGDHARVDAAHQPDLYWALRGGGGDFAVVTGMEIELFPADPVYGGRIAWPLEQAPLVLDTFRAVTAEAPDELTAWFTILRLPDLPVVPDFLRGARLVTVDVTYLGSAEQAAAALRPLDAFASLVPPTMDSRAVIPVAAIDGICQEPSDPMPFTEAALPLTDFGTEQAERLLELEGAGSDSPLLMTQLRHLGGALARRDPDGGARDHIAESYMLANIGIGAGPEAAAADSARLAGMREAMADVLGEHGYYTMLRPDDRAADAFPADVLTRLRQIKRQHDPRGTIRANHPVLAP